MFSLPATDHHTPLLPEMQLAIQQHPLPARPTVCDYMYDPPSPSQTYHQPHSATLCDYMWGWQNQRPPSAIGNALSLSPSLSFHNVQLRIEIAKICHHNHAVPLKKITLRGRATTSDKVREPSYQSLIATRQTTLASSSQPLMKLLPSSTSNELLSPKVKENVTVTVRSRPLSVREINKGDENSVVSRWRLLSSSQQPDNTLPLFVEKYETLIQDPTLMYLEMKLCHCL